MTDVITASNLSKRYGSTVVVDDVSFSVGHGEIFVIVGPNGAGKTTTVEILSGLREPDQGQVRVLGLDPQQEERELRRRIGIQLQEAALPDRLKVWEALDLFASFYAETVPWEPLLEQWGLAEKHDTVFVDLSGGQKQRLFIALALLNDPELVILDELTTGLDPQARHKTWELVRSIRQQGKTVVLVTHFMEEAQALSDRVAIVDHGTIIALDTPQALIQSVDAGRRVVFEGNGAFNPSILEELPPVSRIEQEGRRVVVHGNGDGLVSAVVGALDANGVAYQNLRTEQADLEDVFIALTGRQIRE